MNDEEERLRELVMAEAGNKWDEDEMVFLAAQRINFELSLIANGGWANYFIMVAEMVKAAKTAGGFVSPGRGRAASSAVLYALGVTGVDPFKHEGLMFERFLSSRTVKDACLICVDFDSVGYAAALSYLKTRFGEIKSEQRKCQAAPKWWHVGERCVGVTHLEVLDRIAATIKLIAENGGMVPDLYALPEREPSVLKLLCSADTVDIPGFDTVSARRWINRLRPNDLRDLTIIHALHHSRLESKLIEYEECVHNSSHSSLYGFIASRAYLHETRGVVVYDEQVMLLLRHLGGFTRDEAYRCRKVLACRIPVEVLEYKGKFLSGFGDNAEFCNGENLSVEESHELAERIWMALEHDAMFTSLKSHDVAQVRLACQAAYLKHNYPKEWMFAGGNCYHA